jgi:hypothetical protein
MAGHRPRTLAELLQSSDIAKLRDEAAARRELTTQIRALLPPDEASHLVHAGVDADDRLVLTMDSAVWAARVRFRAEALGAKRVRVRVRPGEEPQSGTPGAS